MAYNEELVCKIRTALYGTKNLEEEKCLVALPL